MTERPSGTFAWTAHPAREQRLRAASSLAVIAALSVSAAFCAGHWLLGLVSAAILVLSLNRFYFPSRFAIDDSGLTAHYPLRTRRLDWQQVRRFAHDQSGGYLSERRQPSWRDLFSGLHIGFGRQGARIADHIRLHLGRGGGA